MRISAAWSGQELREVLQRIGTTAKVPVWLDRRVDPQQAVELRVEALTVEEIMQRLAEGKTWGVSCGAGLVYVGPRHSAEIFPAVTERCRQKVERLPDTQRAFLLQQRAASWDNLTEPRDLLTHLLEEGSIEIANPQLIPHDLMPAAKFPALSLIDLFSVILLGLDLDVEFARDGKTCTLLPLPQEVHFAKTYTLSPHSRRRWRQSRTEFHEVLVKETARHVEIRGTPADHARLQMLLAGPRELENPPSSNQPNSGRNLFSLRLESKPLGPVLEQLARQLQLEVVWQPALLQDQPAILQQRVSCDVQQVELEELLEALLKPLELAGGVEGNAITIGPGPAEQK